jgi:succinate dehydrogenase subunit A (EC 1.3.5.1)
LTLKYAIDRLGEDVVRARYGNLFDMYEEITDENPYKTPMMIFPAIHYTMGGIWVDYELMTSIKGCMLSVKLTSLTTVQTVWVHLH